MAKFNIEKSVDINTDVEVDVHEIYDGMSKDEKEEMAHLVSEDLDILDFIGQTDREKMYKELAYYVGNSDSEHLDALIEELTYWRRK